ncbi:Transposon Tf2-6 poly [Paramuricea clavata]|uniref:Transposon Tf2-6 poly n=1 Tax=Paramuricea clavata TaxID=317549 RepID=A0A6S7IP58_PARCT|nr:Transposon Tf2-6 poly [Paramuricea clavata]
MATSSEAVTATKGPKLKILPFDPHGDRFERFERDLKYNGCDPSKTPEIAKMALSIYAGTEMEDLHDTLPEPGRPEGTEEENWIAYEQSKTKLKIHFPPKQCNDFAIFELLRMKIESSESITSNAMRLRKAASKKKEDAVARSKVIDRDSRQVVNKVGAKRNQPLQQKCTTDQCNRCGHKNHFPASECPAISRICNYCKEKGHYASKCFKKQKEAGIKRIEAEPQTDTGNDTNSDTDEYGTAKIELVNNLGMREKPSLMRVHTNDQEVMWQPDTGTQKDVWDRPKLRASYGLGLG